MRRRHAQRWDPSVVPPSASLYPPPPPPRQDGPWEHDEWRNEVSPRRGPVLVRRQSRGEAHVVATTDGHRATLVYWVGDGERKTQVLWGLSVVELERKMETLLKRLTMRPIPPKNRRRYPEWLV